MIFWWQRGRLSWKRDVLPLVPFFLLGAAAGVFTAWVERTLIGAEGASFALTVVDRGLLAGRAIWFYLGKLIWPVNLLFVYPRWDVSQAVWWQYLFPLAALLLTALLWRLRRRWRGPLAGWLFFVGTLFPVLGFCNVYPFIYSYVADHFQYLASLGIITLASAGTALLLARWGFGCRPGGYLLCLTLLAGLTALTWRQCRMYGDVETLYRTTIAGNPDCWMAHNNLGLALAGRGQVEEAITHYQTALEIKPKFAEAHNNFGVVLGQRGRFDEAIIHFRQALKIKPDYANAHNNFGNALAGQGKIAAAIVQWREAVRLQPNELGFVNQLAWVLATCPEASVRNGAEAIELAQRAVRISGGREPAVLGTLAAAYAEAGRFSEAVQTARKARELAVQQNKPGLAESIGAKIPLYKAGTPFRESLQPSPTRSAAPP